MTRPMWWSVCSMKPAKTSICRAYRRRSSADRPAHARTQGGRSLSTVFGGTMPISSWRAKTASRQASQPASKRPR